MDTIEIDNPTYYDDPKWWPYMPEEIFNALELAEMKSAWNGEKITAKVSRAAFEQMLNDYNKSRND